VLDGPSTGIDDYVMRYWYKPEGGRHAGVHGAGDAGFTTLYVMTRYRPFFCRCLSRSRTMLVSPSGIRPRRRATS
jgi:hypothetical protein